MTPLTSDELKSWLEWAGARLWAMPVGRIKPSSDTGWWPEYSQDVYEILQFRGNLSIRAAAPSAAEIPVMESILLLPNICSRVEVRRVLHIRALVHPLSNRYIFNWSQVAMTMKTDRRTIKRWHEIGLKEVVAKADKAIVCQIAGSLAGWREQSSNTIYKALYTARSAQ